MRGLEGADALAEFSAFVAVRQHALVRFGYVLSGNVQAGEDLAQTALAKLYLKWDTIRDPERREAWVRRVMVNEHTSLWRRAWRRREFLDAEPERGAASRGGAHEDTHHDHDLWALVQTLPTQQRAAVALRFYEDLSEAQTAEILGCSVGTVKSHTHRALAALRAKVQEDRS